MTSGWREHHLDVLRAHPVPDVGDRRFLLLDQAQQRVDRVDSNLADLDEVLADQTDGFLGAARRR